MTKNPQVERENYRTFWNEYEITLQVKGRKQTKEEQFWIFQYLLIIDRFYWKELNVRWLFLIVLFNSFYHFVLKYLWTMFLIHRFLYLCHVTRQVETFPSTLKGVWPIFFPIPWFYIPSKYSTYFIIFQLLWTLIFSQISLDFPLFHFIQERLLNKKIF